MIYELYVGGFSGGGNDRGAGTLKDAIAKLDYLSQLGINAVELMPMAASPGDRNIFGDSAFKRAKLGAVLLMTAVGVPLVWMGNEFGEYNPDEEIKIDWSLLQNEDNLANLDYYRGLIDLKKEQPCFALQQHQIFLRRCRK